MSTPNTTPLTYNGFVTQLATLAVVNMQTTSGVVSGTDAAFNILIPQALNYAELRIQRDLDLLQTQFVNTAYSVNVGTNQVAISVNDFVTIQTITATLSGTTTPLLPVTKEFLQNVYPDATATGLPAYFCMYGGDAATFGNTTQNILVGPWPDSLYALTITGTGRMPTLATYATPSFAGTATTFISVNLPDLLLMASMIYVSGFQRNFGRQSDDPQMAVSYESQYKTLLEGAGREEYRKKFEASAWSSASQSPVATKTRG